MSLAERQLAARDEARRFAQQELAPWADEIDRQQVMPATVLHAVRESGFLGASLPSEWGGGAVDSVSYGLITEEIGRVCSSVRSLLTVHNMSTQAIARFGTPIQKERWLPSLCAGTKIIGFALTEPKAGSAAQQIRAEAVPTDGGFRLNGTKKWISFGQVADLFLIFVKLNGVPTALIVDRETDGLSVAPMSDIFGTRAAMLAELTLRDAAVGLDRQIGNDGMGLSFVANLALDHGRFSVAWGCTGIIRACLEECLDYAEQRRIGDDRLRDFQLIQRQLAEMLVAYSTSRALCLRSAVLRDQGDPRAVMETSLAKYHASSAAVSVATDAVQLHGANGCSGQYPVNRYLRDATVMGIVEGTHEMHQIGLAGYAFQRPFLD